MVFYTGLLQLLKTQDEIAAVMGHEAAHVVARHTVRDPCGLCLTWIFLMGTPKCRVLRLSHCAKQQPPLRKSTVVQGLLEAPRAFARQVRSPFKAWARLEGCR